MGLPRPDRPASLQFKFPAALYRAPVGGPGVDFKKVQVLPELRLDKGLLDLAGNQCSWQAMGGYLKATTATGHVSTHCSQQA
jgi:hypothetical protein